MALGVWSDSESRYCVAVEEEEEEEAMVVVSWAEGWKKGCWVVEVEERDIAFMSRLRYSAASWYCSTSELVWDSDLARCVYHCLGNMTILCACMCVSKHVNQSISCVLWQVVIHSYIMCRGMCEALKYEAIIISEHPQHHHFYTTTKH